MASFPILHRGVRRLETVVQAPDGDNLVRTAVRIARIPGVVEVTGTTEAEHGSWWRIGSASAVEDLEWLGTVIPHRAALFGRPDSKGAYTRTGRGTWRVAMHLVPVRTEGAERGRMIEYRSASGSSVWVAGGRVIAGFTLEVATPRDGTRICQRSLLSMAAEIGVRCEIAAEPRYATLVEGLVAAAREA